MNLKQITDKVHANLVGAVTGNIFNSKPDKYTAQQFDKQFKAGAVQMVKTGQLNVKGHVTLSAKFEVPQSIEVNGETLVLIGCREKNNQLYACYQPANGSWKKVAQADKLQ